MKGSVYWTRVVGSTIASVLLIIPFRFITVNAVVGNETMAPASATHASTSYTGGVYDGVLMKMSDLSYSNLSPYQHESLHSLGELAARGQGPSGIYKQVALVNQKDWHLSSTQANQYFFSDLSGWRIVATDNQEQYVGFYGVAYQKGNTIVIAFRGTNDVEDLVSDAGIYLDVPPIVNQELPAEQFVNHIRKSLPTGDYHIIFTGHSMGGWLAQYMYLQYVHKYAGWQVEGATVFDSIGTNFHPNPTDAQRVKDYRFQGDIFSHYGSSLGSEIRIQDGTPNESLYDKHQMFDFYGYFYGKVQAQTDKA
ncbi:Mbeg1-like protein [Alicyclobacillus suci]|uniref:Mbeg1-like protein n=2 Tax=Alicyclobacillus suci TaxID=2816080 RepID=UPI0011BDF4A6|nr:Mbeg1-like protein [Alicyclobacillus suci]